MALLVPVREVIRMEMTEEQRDAEQHLMLQRYLDRLDHNQWRDPVTGTIRPRKRKPALPRTGNQRGGPYYWRR